MLPTTTPDWFLHYLFSVICGILVVFAVCSDNNDVYAQQSYSQVPAPTPSLQLSQQANTK
jgi:hypothetical protein